MKRSIRVIAALALAGVACAPDTIAPRTGNLAPPSLALRRAVYASATSYPMGRDDQGVMWTLYPAENTVRSSVGEYIELSPELSTYFANIAATDQQLDTADATMRTAIAQHPAPRGPSNPWTPPPPPQAPQAVGRGTAQPIPTPIGGTLNAASTAGSIWPYDVTLPSQPAAGPGPAATRSVRMDLSLLTGDGTHSCRDIAAAWGHMEAQFAKAKQGYQLAAGELFTSLVTLAGTARFNPPPGEGPFPDYGHPDPANLRAWVKQFKNPKELAAYLATRYGPQVAAVNFDVSAANYMDAQTQRGIYQMLFNAYDCQHANWQAAATGSGGGSGGSAVRACYYAVTYVDGQKVSETLLFCQME